MLNGDISNIRSACFGFRAENTLFELRNKSVIDKVANFFKGDLTRAKINKEVYSLMNYIYWNTEYTIMLVIDDSVYQKSRDFLADFPFNQVCNIKSISEVTMMLMTGEMSYYIDDSNTRYDVQSRYTMTTKELNNFIHRSYTGKYIRGRLT